MRVVLKTGSGEGDTISDTTIDTTTEKETRIEFSTEGAEILQILISSPQNAYGEFTILPTSFLTK
jgi:hypothetical protein